ncbi:MAG: extracellular solute-binding protein [Anaerolineae bacterium]
MPPPGPITLTLWHSETGAARQTLEALALDFHKAYPDLTVTPVYVGDEGEMTKKLVAAIAMDQPPDVILVPRQTIPQFVRQEGLVPLDDLRADPSLGLSADDQADLLPGIMDEGSFVEFDNQSYAFPFDLNGMVLFYNADLLQAGSFAPPATWADFADAAGKLTKDNQFGWAMNIDSDVLTGMLVSQGSAPIDMPERHALLGERGGLAALTLAAQLQSAGAAQLEDTRADAIQDFATGNAAFYMDWMSAFPELLAARTGANKNFTIGVSNLPQADPQDSYILFTGSDLALCQTTPDRERRAWFLIRWLTASSQTARWARTTQSIPLRASALTILAQDPANASLVLQIQKSLSNTTPHFVPLSTNPHIAAIDRLMENAWRQSLQPKADIPSLLKNAATDANAILAGNQ